MSILSFKPFCTKMLQNVGKKILNPNRNPTARKLLFAVYFIPKWVWLELFSMNRNLPTFSYCCWCLKDLIVQIMLIVLNVLCTLLSYIFISEFFVIPYIIFNIYLQHAPRSIFFLFVNIHSFWAVMARQHVCDILAKQILFFTLPMVTSLPFFFLKKSCFLER